MKTKLIIVLSLICSLGFGQQVINVGGGGSAPIDTVTKIATKHDLTEIVAGEFDLTGYVEWTDTTTKVATQYDISGFLSGSDTTSLSDRIDAIDLSGYLTGSDTTSLSDRIDAIDVSGYIGWTDTTATIATQYDLTTVSGMSEGAVASQITDSLANSGYLDVKLEASDLSGYITDANARTAIHDSLAAFTIGANEVASVDTIFGMDNGVFSAVPLKTSNINLKTDTIPIFVFGLGSGVAGDTVVFNDNAIAGSFFNSGSDTIHVTALRGVLAEGSGTETIAVQVSWHATFKSGSATNLNSSAYTVTSITTGDNDTSFANAVISPGVFVWCTISGVSAGNKPSLLILTLSGYKVPTY